MRVVLTAVLLALLPVLAGAQSMPNDPQAWLALASSGKLGEVRELMLWDSIRNERNPAAFEEYLRRYPDGTFARIAKLRLDAARPEAMRLDAASSGEAPAEHAAAPSEGTTAAGAITVYSLTPVAGPEAGGDRAASAMVTSRLPDGASVEAYDRAFAVLRAAEYDRAAALLRGFVDGYPADPLVANAQYGLGEIYMVRGDYAHAAASFGDALRAQPDGAKSEDALFKLGSALARDGQGREACGAFERLGREHPLAAARLGVTLIAERRRLGC
jgi:tol-pal system protein YbgF